MSDDARPLIDNPYRASHTPIIAGDVNVTDLMARAWDRGFAAGDERLRSDFQSAASPDERLREAVAHADNLAEGLREAMGNMDAGFSDTNALASACRIVLNEYAKRRPALAAADREAPDDWRCECGDLNRGAEAFCFRCGACPHDDEPKETT